MALVSATEMINKAHEGHYAIAAFNINNLEWTKSILEAVEATKTPVILEVSEGAAKYMCGYKTVAQMVHYILLFQLLYILTMVHTKALKLVLKLALPVLCLMVHIIHLKKI